MPHEPQADRRAEADTPPAEHAWPSRRAVLRGVLAAGCGLLLPGVLLGCDRKTADTAGTAPPMPPTEAEPAAPAPAEPGAAANGTAPAEAAASAAAKASKASVQYQTQPKGGQKCADCLHFIAESNTCKLVEGDISPNGWCTLWTQAGAG